MWAGNLSKLGDGACALLMTPLYPPMHVRLLFPPLHTFLFFRSKSPGPICASSSTPTLSPSKVPLCGMHTHGAHGGGRRGGLVPGASLSESINQADRSSCHTHTPLMCTHNRNYKTHLPLFSDFATCQTSV